MVYHVFLVYFCHVRVPRSTSLSPSDSRTRSYRLGGPPHSTGLKGSVVFSSSAFMASVFIFRIQSIGLHPGIRCKVWIQRCFFCTVGIPCNRVYPFSTGFVIYIIPVSFGVCFHAFPFWYFDLAVWACAMPCCFN